MQVLDHNIVHMNNLNMYYASGSVYRLFVFKCYSIEVYWKCQSILRPLGIA